MPDFNLIVNCSMFVDFEVNFFQDETVNKKSPAGKQGRIA